MRFRFAVLVAALALSAVGVAAAQTEVGDPTPYTCDERSASTHIKQARQTIKAGWSRKNWRSGPKRSQMRNVKQHTRCLERGKDKKAIKRQVREATAKLRLYREYRRVATIPCSARGAFYPDDHWWSKSCYIIACESGFSWNAANSSSSARGPYQMLDTWDRPFPVRSLQDKLRHHISASKLGDSHWVCA